MPPLQVIVDNRIRVPLAGLHARAADALKHEFTHSNQQHHRLRKQIERLQDAHDKKSRAMRFRLVEGLKSEPPRIETWRDEQTHLSFPRGGMTRVREILEAHGYAVDVLDCREEGDPKLGAPPSEHRVTLRDFQADITQQVLRLEQGIIRSPQGSGKTTALISCIAAAGVPSLVIVNTGSLFDQWVKRCRIELGLSANEVGVLSGEEHRLRPVTVGMQQTLWRHAERYKDRFGLIAADEVHLFAANTFQQVLDVFPARYRIGASAMEKRKDGKEFLLYDLLGEPIASVDRQELVDRGLILEVEVRLVPLPTLYPWWLKLPEEQRSFAMGQLLDEFTKDAERNERLVDVVLSETRQGAQVMVLSHRVEHCTRLRAMLVANDTRADGLLIGGGGPDFPRTVAAMLKGQCIAACGTYQAIGTGFDLPRVGRGVCATPIHTNRYFFEQVAGRVARSAEGKSDAVLYYPWDRALFGLAPLRNFCRWSKSVVVREGDAWVDGREYLRREETREAEEGDAS